MKWIVNVLCGTYDQTFHIGPEGERVSAYAAGKRHVGLQIVKHAIGVSFPAKK
jgi:hypothetical protein